MGIWWPHGPAQGLTHLARPGLCSQSSGPGTARKWADNTHTFSPPARLLRLIFWAFLGCFWENPIGRTLRRLVEASHRELAIAIKMGRPSQEIALALQLPVLGTFWRVPERFWEPSRRFLNRVFTGFFCLLFLCCFFCFFSFSFFVFLFLYFIFQFLFLLFLFPFCSSDFQIPFCFLFLFFFFVFSVCFLSLVSYFISFFFSLFF